MTLQELFWSFEQDVRTFLPTSDTDGPLSNAADIFHFSGHFPITCGPNPDTRGPILFTLTPDGLMVTSASRADCFFTSGPFPLCIEPLTVFFITSGHLPATREPFPSRGRLTPNTRTKTPSRMDRFYSQGTQRTFSHQVRSHANLSLHKRAVRLRARTVLCHKRHV